jgi:ABC-type dipeptide/oligopeptide/nickel transport system permease component
MFRYILRRLLIIPVALLLVNLLAFSYAHISLFTQRAANPYGLSEEGPPEILPLYAQYLQSVSQGDFGTMPVGVGHSIAQGILTAAGNSLGLLLISFYLTLLLGVVLAMVSVKVDPGRVSRWLAPLSTIGMALPSFFIGTLFVVLTITYLRGAPEGTDPILPVGGFGWNEHMIMPVIALTIRPAMQIAQVLGQLLAGELDKQYITASRAYGRTWQRLKSHDALRNVLGPLLLTMAGSLRLLIAELILVETFFEWPGLGRLLVLTLIPPKIAGVGGLEINSSYFLDPPLVAAVVTTFTFFFLLVDSIASIMVRVVDPRLRPEGVSE